MENNQRNNIMIMVFSLAVILVVGFLFFNNTEEEDSDNSREQDISEETEGEEVTNGEEKDEDDSSFKEEIKSLANNFIGKSYKEQPLDEDNLYNEEGFDSTTLILSLAAKLNSPDDPEEEMKKINYYPAGEIFYENRLHFSTYRNKVSDYFNDITKDLGGDYSQEKTVILNKKKSDGNRLLDIEWEEEVTFYYIPTESVDEISEIEKPVTGVMFLVDGDEDIGLDVRSEGLLIDGSDIIYSSSLEDSVVKEDFDEYLEDTDFDGVVFYEFVKISNN